MAVSDEAAEAHPSRHRPSPMDIYHELRRARSHLDLKLDLPANRDFDIRPATARSRTSHRYSQHWVSTSDPRRRKSAELRAALNSRGSTKTVRTSHTNEAAPILAQVCSLREENTSPSLSYVPIGDLSVRHSGRKQDQSEKWSVWDENGCLSPLTREAMHRNGVLANELKPTTPPQEVTPVSELRYNFLESKRKALEHAVLTERNKLASLQSARTGSKEALRHVFQRFAASQDAAGMSLQSLAGAARGNEMDLTEFIRCLNALQIIPELLASDDASNLFGKHQDDARKSINFEVFFSVVSQLLRNASNASLSVPDTGSRGRGSQHDSLQHVQQTYGKSVEAELTKKRQEIAHLKAVEEKRLALEFQNDINNKNRKLEMLAKLEHSSKRTARRMEELAASRARKREQDIARHNEVMAKVSRRNAEQAALEKQHAKNKLLRDEHQRRQREQRMASERLLKTELMRLESEHLQQRRLRTQRAEEYQRQALEQALKEKGRRKDVIQAEKKKLMQERAGLARGWSYRHHLLQKAKAQITHTGLLRQVPKELEGFQILNNFCDPHLVCHFDLKDPESTLLHAGADALHGVLRVGEYDDYRLWIPAEMCRCTLRLQLKAQRGDTDLYVGNGDCPQPRLPASRHTWHKAGFGDDKLLINYFDPAFSFGWCYVSVYAASSIDGVCEYSVAAQLLPVVSGQVII